MNLTICMPIADSRGGAEALLDHFVSASPSTDLRVSVFFLEAGPMADRFAAAGVPVAVAEARRLRDVGRFFGVVRALSAFLHTQKADVLLNWMTKAHLYGALAARYAGIPAVWYQHGVPDPTDLITRLATLLPAKGVLACSQMIADAQAALWPRRRVLCVPPCVDLSAFAPQVLPPSSAARCQLGLPSVGPVVGMVARMQHWKGVHVFVDAMAEVLRLRPDAHGVIVGGRHALEPEYPEFVDARINAHGLTGRVWRVGFQRDVPLWMQAMDVVVHASDHEPFGMVVIEAMALGKPVVASASGGPREIVTDGVDGFLAPHDDPNAIARRIVAYLDAPALARQTGTVAERRAEQFSKAHYPGQVRRALATLL
jgi:glycosyltransferase involved in cell wall biosynthesis